MDRYIYIKSDYLNSDPPENAIELKEIYSSTTLLKMGFQNKA
jgi:hypothetical protein